MSYQSRKSQIAEIIPDRFYLALLQSPASSIPTDIPTNSLCYWLDDDLIYEPFCADFGPCNLAHSYRFCENMKKLLAQAEDKNRRLYLLVGAHPHKRANAAALVGIFSVLYLDRRPEEAYAPLRPMGPFTGFRDASCGISMYDMGIYDVIRGISRARDVGFIRWAQGEEFDVEEYEYYEQVENGDFNWIVPGKLMAFSGPSAQPKYYGGWRTFTPEDYIDYFHENNVTAVVRLNKKMYDSASFTNNGVNHYDLYFPDGTCPTEAIMQQFLHLVEEEPGSLAVHCKAGLGRTGVLICCYMIKHYGFTAEEAMGYIRVCRPGSVLGPQQNYLLQHGPRLLHEGRMLRANKRVASSVVAMEGVDSANNDLISVKENASAGRLVSITASSVTADMEGVIASEDTNTATEQQQQQQQYAVRRSPRLAASSTTASPVKSNPSAFAAMASVNSSPMLMRTRTLPSSMNVDDEPNHIVSVAQNVPPPCTMATQQSSPLKDRPTTPSRKQSLPTMSYSRSQSMQSVDGSSTPTGQNLPKMPPPPSSTKRLVAPNGQPRKIPLAMDFDMVANAHELEDRDASDDWTLSSRPQVDRNPASGGKKVGVLAAAAGRGASAFVDAFRGVMGAYRSPSPRRL